MDYEDDDDEERIIILNQHKQSLSRMTSQQTSGKRSDSTAEETVQGDLQRSDELVGEIDRTLVDGYHYDFAPGYEQYASSDADDKYREYDVGSLVG